MRSIYASFIFASAFAYLAGFWLVILGTPPILNIPPGYQAAVFIIMAFASFLASQINREYGVRTLLAVVWGMMAAFTFTGYVVWAPAGDSVGRVFMTLWDLALAVAVLDE